MDFLGNQQTVQTKNFNSFRIRCLLLPSVLVLECELLFSRLWISLGTGDGTRVSYNTTGLTVLTEVQPFFLNKCSGLLQLLVSFHGS